MLRVAPAKSPKPGNDARRARERTVEWNRKNARRKYEYNKIYTERNREKTREWSQRHTHRVKMAAITALGGKCARCGFLDWRALQINHINGGGSKEYRSRHAEDIYKDVIRGTRNDLELLCANCNWIHRFENNLHSYNQPNKK